MAARVVAVAAVAAAAAVVVAATTAATAAAVAVAVDVGSDVRSAAAAAAAEAQWRPTPPAAVADQVVSDTTGAVGWAAPVGAGGAVAAAAVRQAPPDGGGGDSFGGDGTDNGADAEPPAAPFGLTLQLTSFFLDGTNFTDADAVRLVACAGGRGASGVAPRHWTLVNASRFTPALLQAVYAVAVPEPATAGFSKRLVAYVRSGGLAACAGLPDGAVDTAVAPFDTASTLAVPRRGVAVWIPAILLSLLAVVALLLLSAITLAKVNRHYGKGDLADPDDPRAGRPPPPSHPSSVPRRAAVMTVPPPPPSPPPPPDARLPTHEEVVDTETLGRATWTFLHTLAASYPAAPSAAEAARMARFLRDFAALYPCAPCASSFRRILDRLPPDVRGGGALPAWMCAAHNAVNAELHKPLFDCATVGRRWGVCEACTASAPALAQFQSMVGLGGRGGRRRKVGGGEAGGGEAGPARP
ncbi:hypothetical protein BU14_0746s0010 [Porphyra umbilicalis]|uniref:Sulfhydryl oxidase n=1 Tax=Porphyra umbilicalis TaxID=2786 RepID=A0A1X6NPL3_PORUM|nr:hypothetical protein BU14_0746s0010 [Porphyra umbilicalis]|eukprot:OSX70470.1 hypothetical protein BU14_0746s0010 [Porphyra umbilicalis]